MLLEEHIRKLARSSYWQGIYHASKDCNGVRLFKNEYDFSGLQSIFLYWLRCYSMLYEELNKLEWENLDEKVIKDNDRCDAFLYYRGKQIEKEYRKAKAEERKGKRKSKTSMKIFSGAKNKDKNE